jgi:hypothetical protein
VNGPLQTSGANDSVIVIDGDGRVTGMVAGSPGNDMILISGGSAQFGSIFSIAGGDGDDQIDVCGAATIAAPVLAGSGDDCLRVEGVSGLTLDGGDDTDVCSYQGNGTVTLNSCESTEKACQANPCATFVPPCTPVCTCTGIDFPCHTGSPCDDATCVVIE